MKIILEVIYILKHKYGVVRFVDVARYMGFSKPHMCYAVGTLQDGGFLTTDKKRYLQLIEFGGDVAEKFTNAIVFYKALHIHSY